VAMRRFVLVLVALLGVTAAVFAATDAFRANAAVCQSKASVSRPSFVGDAPANTLSVSYNRHNGLLRSVVVHARPQTANACTEVEVLGRGPNQPVKVVYRDEVAMPAVSAWSGTLPTRLWSGGCQAGWHYFIDTISVAPGSSLGAALSVPPSSWGRDGKFELSGVRLDGCRAGASESTH
jgi:hypothetical protein